MRPSSIAVSYTQSSFIYYDACSLYSRYVGRRFWGEGFTEWTLLKPLDLPQISKPLAPAQGGLGYYDLTEKKVRQQQAAMNHLYGGHGFVYYHYWFSGKGAPIDHKVMYRVPELMLKDGEPGGPFMFSWANEPWSRRYLIFSAVAKLWQ